MCKDGLGSTSSLSKRMAVWMPCDDSLNTLVHFMGLLIEPDEGVSLGMHCVWCVPTGVGTWSMTSRSCCPIPEQVSMGDCDMYLTHTHVYG